jgi:hypothetical protein
MQVYMNTAVDVYNLLTLAITNLFVNSPALGSAGIAPGNIINTSDPKWVTQTWKKTQLNSGDLPRLVIMPKSGHGKITNAGSRCVFVERAHRISIITDPQHSAALSSAELFVHATVSAARWDLSYNGPGNIAKCWFGEDTESYNNKEWVGKSLRWVGIMAIYVLMQFDKWQFQNFVRQM